MTKEKATKDCVSVLIPLYNAENYIEACIKSVLAQTHRNIELIIVDDGSTDASYLLAKQYAAANVIVVKQNNGGVSLARNTAFTLSTGDYIQYLDADDILEPRKIEHQVAILKHNKANAFVFGALAIFKQSIDNNSLHTAPYFKSYLDSFEFLIDYWGYGGMIQIATCLIPREKIIAAGAWNKSLLLNEDGEYISRLIKNTTQVIYVPQSITYYRTGNADSLSGTYTYKHYQSLLMSYNLYYELIADYANDKRVILSLGRLYSRIIYVMYPNYVDLQLLAEKKLLELGFKSPLPVGRLSFRLIVYLLGSNSALKLREFIRAIIYAKNQHYIT